MDWFSVCRGFFYLIVVFQCKHLWPCYTPVKFDSSALFSHIHDTVLQNEESDARKDKEPRTDRRNRCKDTEREQRKSWEEQFRGMN